MSRPTLLPLAPAAVASAVAAAVPPFAAALTGATAAAIGLIAMVTLPAVTLLAARRHPAATVAGALHLVLLPVAFLSAQGADLRVPLTGALLAIAGLHAGRVVGDRDRSVATLIQLAVVAATLSQLQPGEGLRAGLIVAAWGGAVAVTRQLSQTALAAGGLVVSGRATRGRWVPVLALLAVAALVWAVLPTPGAARQAREVGGTSGSDLPPGTIPPPDPSAAGQARVGLSSGAIDLTQRGTPSNRPAVQVRGASGLLRGVVYGSYDGTTWSPPGDGASLHRLTGSGQDGATFVVPRLPDDGDLSVTTPLRVRLLEQQDTVLAKGRPLEVVLPGGVVDADDFGSLPVVRRLPAGTEYATLGGVPAESPAGVPAQPTDASTFLQLPDELPQRVRDLAAQWTAGAGGDPLARAAAIDEQLRAGYRYQLDSPVPAAGHDAVDDMLFRSRRGFCEQFASAAAVLLRSLGVPARVVAGYSVDDAPDADGWTTVTDMQAHAWIEVWEPGRGWIADDPTAGVPLAPSDAGTKSTIPLLRWLEALGVWGLVGLGVAVVVLVLVVLVVRRRRRRVPLAAGTGAAAGGPGPPGPVAAAWAELEAALAGTGTPRRASETPAELLLRVPGGWEVRRIVLPPLEREIWGPGVPTPAESAAAQEQLRRLAARLTPAPVA